MTAYIIDQMNLVLIFLQ